MSAPVTIVDVVNITYNHDRVIDDTTFIFVYMRYVCAVRKKKEKKGP